MSFSRQALQGHNLERPLGLFMAIMFMNMVLGCAAMDFNQVRNKHAEEEPTYAAGIAAVDGILQSAIIAMYLITVLCNMFTRRGKDRRRKER